MHLGKLALFLSSQLGSAFPVVPRDDTPTDPAFSEFTFTEGFRSRIVLPTSLKHLSMHTIVADTFMNSLFISQDFGATWNKVDSVPDVTGIAKSESDENKIIAFSGSGARSKIYISFDRGQLFTEVTLPPQTRLSAAVYALLDHPQNPDWLIFNGEKCESRGSCTPAAYYSKDRGTSWTFLQPSTSCYWIAPKAKDEKKDDGLPKIDPNLIYCEGVGQYGNVEVLASTNFFQDSINLGGAMQIAQDRGFVIRADNGEDDSRELEISRDGINFNRARYPPQLPRSTARGVNILDNDQSLMIFETEGPKDDFGTILHSGKNGNEFTVVLEKVSRPNNKGGFIDFERLRSVEGVLLANVVANADEVKNSGAAPIVKSVISHSDGAKWDSIKEQSGKELQLHSFTDRLLVGEKPSTPIAIGIYIARGNIGDKLGNINEAKTYMTRDAGISWYEIAERPSLWAIGGYGGVIVLVDHGYPAEHLQYSLDEGLTWHRYSWGFRATIWSLETTPSGSGYAFLMMVIPEGQRKYRALSFNFASDGSALCKVDKDFEEWTPDHPQLKTTCMLGRVVKYIRRINGRDCYIPPFFVDGETTPSEGRIEKNCACTRDDYECDYTHQLDPKDNECKLVSGQKIPSKEDQCKNGAIAYKKITGYRKLAASSCEGEYLEEDRRYACPGKEKEFNEGKDNGAGDAPPRPPPGEGPGGNPPDNNPPDGIPPPPEDGGGTPTLPPAPPSQEGGSSVGGFFSFIAFLAIVAIVVKYRMQILALASPYISRYTSLSLPDDNEDVLHGFSNWWNLVKSYIPFFGSQIPHDHLGFYSRMDDDERYQILEEGSEYDDGEHSDFFVDEEEDTNVGGDTGSALYDEAYHDNESEGEQENHNGVTSQEYRDGSPSSQNNEVPKEYKDNTPSRGGTPLKDSTP